MPTKKDEAGLQKGRRFFASVFVVEIYILTLCYLRNMFGDTNIVEALVGFYIGFGLILAFAFFQLGHSAADAFSRLSALTLIRLSITVNTMPSFVTIFERVRKEEIGGMGRNGLAFSPISVYFAKFITVSLIRIGLFIPFVCIVYPIIGLQGGFDKALVFFLVLVFQQAAAISVGLLVSALFRDRNVAATIITMVTLLTFLFSGNIISRQDTPTSIRWIEYLSLSFYANQALVQNEFNGQVFDDGNLSGEQFLQEQGMAIIGIWPSVGALAGYTIICSIFGILALSITSDSF